MLRAEGQSSGVWRLHRQTTHYRESTVRSNGGTVNGERVVDGILSAIGHTPLVRLTRVIEEIRFHLYAKLEAFNPAGSIKDRTAFSIISNAIETGEVRSGTTVIESSSGNMAIGLAQACAYFGLRFICVVDAKTTKQNIQILKAYGAEVDVITEPDAVTGEFLTARIQRVRTLLRSTPNSYWPDQYSNIYNARAHYQTMDEVVTALGGRVDYLFCSTSTCGTLRGCAEYLRANKLDTKIFAVDAEGSVIFGGLPNKRLLPGHGAARRPGLYQDGLAERCIHVSDLDCVIGCHRLLRREAIMAGASSGGVLMAVESIKDEIPPGANCVVLLPDRGERYLDTVYSDEWVREHFGDVSRFWQYSTEARARAKATTLF
ncbi:MAG TPA: 2,3-diaminopropionate biosynthesis protein SbnA [Blastocatellia bacterium]|nr:2,3-diaminopropionate biosynthesis protein SbnA [Blastocatellia bacterium]